NAAALGGEAASKPRVRKYNHAMFLDLGVHVLHELRIVYPLGTLLTADQARDQSCAEGRHFAAGVVEWKQGDVELAVDHCVPLIIWLEQRGAWINLNVDADIRT